MTAITRPTRTTLDRLEGEGRVAFRYAGDGQRLGARHRRHPQRGRQRARHDAPPRARGGSRAWPHRRAAAVRGAAGGGQPARLTACARLGERPRSADGDCPCSRKSGVVAALAMVEGRSRSRRDGANTRWDLYACNCVRGLWPGAGAHSVVLAIQSSTIGRDPVAPFAAVEDAVMADALGEMIALQPPAAGRSRCRAPPWSGRRRKCRRARPRWRAGRRP